MNTITEQGFVGTGFNDRLRQILHPNFQITNLPESDYSDSGDPPNYITNLTDDNPFIQIVSFADIDSNEGVVETTLHGEDSEEAQAFLEESDTVSKLISEVLVKYGIRRFALNMGVGMAMEEISKALPSELSYADDFKTALPKVERALLMETAKNLANILKCEDNLITDSNNSSNPMDTLTKFLSTYAEKTGKLK